MDIVAIKNKLIIIIIIIKISVDSHLIFSNINPSEPCWIFCAIFFLIQVVFFTRFTSETKSVTPIYLWHKRLIIWLHWN